MPAEAASQPEAAEPIQRRPTPKPQRKPPPPAGHWSSLADDLGIDVPSTDASEDQVAAQHEAGTTSPTMRFPGDSGNDSSGYEPTSLETEALYGASAETEEAADFGDLSEDLGDVSTGGEEESEEKRPRRRRRRRRRQPRPEGAEESGADRDPGDLYLEESATDEETAQTEPADGAEESADQQRPRRRRRRGRGRSGSRDTNHDVARESSSPAAAGDEFSDDELEEENQDLDEENRSDSSRQSHRKIPTWEESIGIIITANMESRTKSVAGDRQRGRGRDGR